MTVVILEDAAADVEADRHFYVNGFEKDSRMVPAGYIFFTVGLIFCLYWQVKFLAIAYNRSAWWLFGCLFVPFVDWIFFFLNFKATRKAFALNLVGMIIAGLGAWMAGVVLPD